MCIKVLGCKNMQILLRIISISDPHISFNRLRCAKKYDRNEINSCGEAIAFGYAFA